MEVSFCLIGIDASLGNEHRIWEEDYLVQLQGSERSWRLLWDSRLDIKPYKFGSKNCVNGLVVAPKREVGVLAVKL